MSNHEKYKVTHIDMYGREPDIEKELPIRHGPKETMEAIAKLINSIDNDNALRYYHAIPAGQPLRNDYEN